MKKIITLSIALIIAVNVFATTYTSVVSGNYNNSAVWSPVGIPISGDDIIISSGHTITLTANQFVKSITIQSNAILDNGLFTLKISSPFVSNPVYLNNGIHNGIGALILYDNANTEFDGNGMVNCPIEINSFGIAIKNTSSLTVSGISHSNPGNFGMNNKTIIDNTQGGSIVINGNINTDLQYSVGILNAFGNIVVNGNVFLQGGTPAGAGSNIENSDNLIITGDLHLAATQGFLWNKGVTIIGGDVLGGGIGETFIFQESNSTIKFGGQVFPLVNDGELLASGVSLLTAQAVEPNTVEYNGTAFQTIKSPSDGISIGAANNINTYSNLIINNIIGVDISSNIKISDTLKLSNGIVNTASDTIELLNTSSNSLQLFSQNSFVNGNFRRKITSNNDTYSFPIGYGTTANEYYRLDFINNNLNGTTFLDANVDAVIETGNNIDAQLSTQENGFPITNVENSAIWSLIPDAQPTAGDFGIELYIQNIAGLTDNLFSIVKRPNLSVDYADWNSFETTTSIPANGLPGRIVSSGFAQKNGFTQFSEFAIGTIDTSSTVSINTFELNDIVSIYPNPVSDKVIINFGKLINNENNVSINLFDVLGNKIAQAHKINDTMYEIKRNSIAQGVYFIQITVGEIISTKKVIFN